MKHNYLFIIIISFFLFGDIQGHAQTWQWARSGGTPVSWDFMYEYENAQSVETDPFGNVYFVSSVGNQGLIIDGIPKEVYGGMGDGLLASFGCDGAYRWSKVIGGFDHDELMRVQTDAQGNVYAVGKIQPLQQNDWNPVYTHFDNDTILPVSYTNVNTYKKSLFLIKYDTDGNMQWLRMPQKDDISLIESTTMYRCLDLQVDPEGNSYWLCYLSPGPVADGAYTVNGTGITMHILKYDTEGNFIEGIPFPMHATSGALLNFHFNRNHNNGNFYIDGSIFNYDGSTESATIAGSPILGSRYVAAFDASGNSLWVRTNTGNAMWGHNFQGLAFDEDNNIYFSSSANKQDYNYEGVIDGFNNIPFEPHPSFINYYSFPFLVKLDSSGNTIWQTSGSAGSPTGVAVNGNEVAIIGAGKNLSWQSTNFSYPTPDTQGLHPFLIRFNKETGALADVNFLTTTGGDFPHSVAVDQNGSYFVGGWFSQSLTASNTVTNIGSHYDFFLAKFGTDNCTLTSVENTIEKRKLWPNPVNELLNLNNTEMVSYNLYNILGREIFSGTLGINGQINFSKISSGIYILQLKSIGGAVETVKIIRE